jgi:hypothetical protein
MRHRGFKLVAFAVLVVCFLALSQTSEAQQKRFLSIATGGTGGVYFPYGGALASLITKNIPNTEATAEVTAASVANMRLIHTKKSDLAFTLADTLYDAVNGLAAFKTDPGSAIKTFALASLYSNFTHLVTVEGRGVNTLADLKGKRVSVGAPASGTELIAIRILEAIGLDATKDIKQEKLGVAESVAAIKDNKIDAFFWSGGLPTAAVTDLANTPNLKMVLLDVTPALAKLQEKFGKDLYVKGTISKTAYKTTNDVPTIVVLNVLVVRDGFENDMAYAIIKLMFDKRDDLLKVHPVVNELTLESAIDGSPATFHLGAIKFYCEKKVWPKADDCK